MNGFKNRLRSGRPCIGAWMQIPSITSAEAMCSMGFHWIAIDLEHSSNTLTQAEHAFIAARAHGVAGFARIPSADPHLARNLLDCGAQGLIIANVDDRDEFAGFAEHCVYPPRGKRGVGLARFNYWGDNFQEYLAEFEPVLIPQIESIEGVSAAPDLVAMDLVDGLFLGPYDLSASLGQRGNFATKEFEQAILSVRDACREQGKPVGIHQVELDPEELETRISEGYSFVAYGTDILAMRHALKNPFTGSDEAQ